VYARGESEVECRREGAGAALTLDTPQANCESHEMTKILDAAILPARKHPNVHASVLRRSGSRDRT
jgi:enoyl-CoA hydratase/carnithine racemase